MDHDLPCIIGLSESTKKPEFPSAIASTTSYAFSCCPNFPACCITRRCTPNHGVYLTFSRASLSFSFPFGQLFVFNIILDVNILCKCKCFVLPATGASVCDPRRRSVLSLWLNCCTVGHKLVLFCLTCS